MIKVSRFRKSRITFGEDATIDAGRRVNVFKYQNQATT